MLLSSVRLANIAPTFTPVLVRAVKGENALIVREGRDAGTSKELCLRDQHAVYSGARTVDTTAVFDFDGHVERLLPIQPPVADRKAFREQCVRATHEAMLRFITLNQAHAADDFKLTYVLSPSHELFVHVTPLLPHRSPCVVELMNAPPRSNASVKSTSWVAERQTLEERMSNDANEIVLTHEGELFEGSQSNFFALEADGTLVTAPSEYVLTGTVQRFLLECVIPSEFPSLRVERRCPLVRNAHSWRGAFLTSTSRWLLPIETLRIVPDAPRPRTVSASAVNSTASAISSLALNNNTTATTNQPEGTLLFVPAAAGEEIHMPQPIDSIITHLREAVMRMVRSRATPILSAREVHDARRTAEESKLRPGTEE